MAEKLPSIVSTFKVVGRLVRSVIDSSDIGQEPDVNPVSGARVIFTPTVNPPIFRIPTVTPPITVFQESIVATTDANGFLKAPDDTSLGVVLPWGFDPDITPNGWGWSVRISGIGNFPERSFVIAGSSGGVVDLATVIPVPPSPGAELSQWQQVTNQVTTARDQTFQARDQALAALNDSSLAQEVSLVRTLVNGKKANLNDLQTTAKSNLVAAINELKTDIGNAITTDGGRLTYQNNSWPSRPVSDKPQMWVSTTNPNAPEPPNMVVGDMWIRHPDALELL